MALPTTTYTVKGREYTTTLLPASESLVLLPRIITLLGKELTQLLLATDNKPPAPGVKSPLEVLLADPEVMAATFHTICTNAMKQGGDGLLLLRDIVRHTTCKHVQLAESIGEAPLIDAFDEHFAGELMDLMLVCIYAARASFTKPSRK